MKLMLKRNSRNLKREKNRIYIIILTCLFSHCLAEFTSGGQAADDNEKKNACLWNRQFSYMRLWSSEPETKVLGISKKRKKEKKIRIRVDYRTLSIFSLYPLMLEEDTLTSRRNNYACLLEEIISYMQFWAIF